MTGQPRLMSEMRPPEQHRYEPFAATGTPAGRVVLSASANCPACGMQALPAGPQAGHLARQAAVTHHTLRGHPVDVVVVTRETIGGDAA